MAVQIDFNVDDITLKLNKWLFIISTSGRMRIWLKLAKLINNQVLLRDALANIRDQRIEISGEGHQEVAAINAWLRRLNNGASLSDSVSGWVTDSEQMLIAAGEKAGEVEQSLKAAVLVMESQSKIRSAILGGLMYPIFLTILAFSVLFVFGYKVIPAFNRIVPSDRWHGLAKSVVELSMFANHWMFFILGAMLFLLLAFIVSLPRFDGPVRVFLDRYPPYNTYRIVQGSSWLIAIAFLVQSGMRIETGLEQMASNSSKWMKNRLNACLAGMRDGSNMGVALRNSGYGFPDQEIISDMCIYAAVSGFDKALEILGREWIEESVKQIKAKMNGIFGICLLLVAVLVGFMVSGLMDMQLQMAKVMQGSLR